ncbi:MAG: hypothetical protein U0229_07380 [Anaeromyxobacter sp.]
MTWTRAAAALAALALAACGPSKEEERLKTLKQQCEASVGGTIRDLEITYGGLDIQIRALGVDQSGNLVLACGTDISKLQCTSDADRCILGFFFPRSSDPGTCGATGCYFTCEVRADLADLAAHQDDHLATICGARWDQHLDVPPFYYDPYLFEVNLN